jgi:hypothetical protein
MTGPNARRAPLRVTRPLASVDSAKAGVGCSFVMHGLNSEKLPSFRFRDTCDRIPSENEKGNCLQKAHFESIGVLGPLRPGVFIALRGSGFVWGTFPSSVSNFGFSTFILRPHLAARTVAAQCRLEAVERNDGVANRRKVPSSPFLSAGMGRLAFLLEAGQDCGFGAIRRRSKRQCLSIAPDGVSGIAVVHELHEAFQDHPSNSPDLDLARTFEIVGRPQCTKNIALLAHAHSLLQR